MPSNNSTTISDVLVEYSEIEEPQTQAHELWIGANWFEDQLNINFREGGLTEKNQSIMVIEEKKQGGYIEIHHTHSEPVPDKIKGITSEAYCEIVGVESQLHSDRNIVHSIIWVVPRSAVERWEQPQPCFNQYESFEKASNDNTNVGELGDENDAESTETQSASQTTRNSRQKQAETPLSEGVLKYVLSWIAAGFIYYTYNYFVEPAIFFGTLSETMAMTQKIMEAAVTICVILYIVYGVGYLVKALRE